MRMRFFSVVFAIAVLQVFVVAPVDGDEKKAEELAAKMLVIAPRCTELSIEEMKALRLQFLRDNQDETVGDFRKALEKSDIVARFKSYNTQVCSDCAKIMQADSDLGKKYWFAGWVSIKTAMDSGILK